MDVSSLHPPFLILELNSFNSIGSELFFTLSSIYHPPLNDRYPLHKNFISNEFCGEKLGVIPKPRRAVRGRGKNCKILFVSCILLGRGVRGKGRGSYVSRDTRTFCSWREGIQCTVRCLFEFRAHRVEIR